MMDTEPVRLRLGYVGIDTTEIDAWERLSRDAIGFDTERLGPNLICRIDEHARRFVVRDSASNGIAYIGWQTDTLSALRGFRQRIEFLGVPCAEIDAAGLRERGVGKAFSFQGPEGLPFEISCEPKIATRPLGLKGLSGFIAGASGMGHIAVQVADLRAARESFEKMLGARLTDEVTGVRDGQQARLNFLRLNERHHSIALAHLAGATPPKAVVRHVMVEAATIEDVGAACIRCKAMGYSLPMDAGKHANDKVVSFYVQTPSGFSIEIGWGAVVIEDEAAWQPTIYRDQQSLWGHQSFNV